MSRPSAAALPDQAGVAGAPRMPGIPMPVKLAVIKESRPGEDRVAIVPEVAAKLAKTGVDVVVQTGAGVAARFGDQDYVDAGAVIAPDAASALQGAAFVAHVQPLTVEEVALLAQGASVMSLLQPLASTDVVEALAAKGATAYSLDLLPRISRAQSMDALSSQATVAGYRAGLSAAEHLAKFFPMFMTAAGTVPPAKVLVMGAGVAGLQAIATARRLGAVVRAYDVRAAAKEEVQSLGAKFVELALETQDGAGGYAKEQSAEYLAKQQELLAAEVAGSDVVITTAQIPGRKAPVLITAAMVDGMSEGAVIIDMAADSGGNCELSVAGQDVVVHGVIVVGTCVGRSGEVVHGPTAEALGLAPPTPSPPPAPDPAPDPAPASDAGTDPESKETGS